MNIVFLDSDTISLKGDVDFSPLSRRGNFICGHLTAKDNPVDLARGAEVVVTNKIVLDKKAISQLPELKLVCVIATGFNNVDVKAAGASKKYVSNVPGYAQYSVSQHTFALILNLFTSCHRYLRDVEEGLWSKSNTFNLLNYPGLELYKKTLGIIGFGAIGRAVADLALAFGMDVLVYSRSFVPGKGINSTDLETLLKESDVVSIHCPLTQETTNLISARELKLMKNSSILINTARGGIVNEADLARALKEGQIAGAGLDVLSKEPPNQDNPLLAPGLNAIITPHCAWSTREARQRLVDITGENILAYQQGKPINLVS